MFSKNILFTIAENYSFFEIKPFLKSFRDHNTKASLILFYKNLSPDTIRKLEKYNVIAIEYDDTNKIISNRFSELNEYLLKIGEKKLSPNSLRYFFYLSYLKSHTHKNARVILSDIRDVYFQRDPFDYHYPTGLVCFLEDENELIGTNKHTQIWLDHSYGKAVLKKISSNLISCSGVTIGNPQAILEYLDKMTSELIKFSNLGGLDQGIHNYLIYCNKLEDVNLIADDEGPVSTISYFKDFNKIRLNKQNEVVNKFGTPVQIVHQYDRSWKLLRKINLLGYFKGKWNYLKRDLLKIKLKILGDNSGSL